MTINIDNGISLRRCIFSGIFFVVWFACLAGCAGGGTEAGNPSEKPQDLPEPKIVEITPKEVKAGSTVTITGSGFGDDPSAGRLFVGGVAMESIISWSDQEIQAVVPEEALTGKIKATINGEDSDDEMHLIVLWDEQNPTNVAIPGNHSSPMQAQLISDGSGGVIIVWRDDRNYNPPPPPSLDPFLDDPMQLILDPPPEAPKLINIYAQHLNSRGQITWDLDGVPLSLAVGGQFFPQLVPDGEGGAIVVWEDYRRSGDSDIYAQRIDKDGLVLWPPDVAICSAAGDQGKPKIISDGAGGAVIVWQDFRSGEYEVYAQRINGDGVPQWAADGVAISTVPNNPQQLFPEITSDGSDGAIIVWQDFRNDAELFIYAQKIDGNGAVAWEDNGVRVSSVPASYQYVARPLSDGSGGAIIAWRGGTYKNGKVLWAQRINESGELQWGSEGSRIPSTPYTRPLQIISDENGGAIIAWEDDRDRSDIYAQRLDSSGNIQWSAEGVPICTAQYDQYGPQMTSDNMGGAIITWYDYRNYNIVVDDTLQAVDVYAQRINKEGEVLWTADGVEISTAKHSQMYPEIASDGYGGAVIIWEDGRSGTGVNIYAQGVSASGNQ